MSTIILNFTEPIWMVKKKNTERFLGSNLQWCLHATVLLAVKYSAELNKKLFVKNTGFKDRKISLAAKAARAICLYSQPVFSTNNPHYKDIFV